MTDPRVVSVEDNLIDFFGTAVRQPMFTRQPDVDVVACSSDVPFPLFNPVFGARFAPGTGGGRAADLAARMQARGMPFMWWATPSTWSRDLHDALLTAGLSHENVPGMYMALGGPLAKPALEGVDVRAVDLATEARPFLDTLVAAFGMPDWLVEPFTELCRPLLTASFLNVLATLDGEPVATASGWVSGRTVGLYNIATLEEHRGRGLGYAVTARVMELGAERGATEAILHSTPMGQPVYERLGFDVVCRVPQYTWVPVN